MGQQLEENTPLGAGRSVRFDSSCLSPSGHCRVRTPTVSSGYGLGCGKAAVIASRPVGQEPGQQRPPNTRPRFLFVLPCLKKDATSCRTQQSCNKIVTIKHNHAGVAAAHRSDAASHSGELPQSWGKAQMASIIA